MVVMENNRDEIAEYIEGPADEYLMILRQEGYGDELVIKYMKDIYGVDITIWTEDYEEGAIESAGYSINEGVMNISYRDGIHYDAVVPVTVVLSSSIEKVARNQEGAPMGITPIDVDSSAEVGDTRNLGKLKVIFWNSNGWEQERCDKIAEAALEEEADVICIQDARMHPAREGHMKGYEKRLERVTGKKWRGKVTNRPEKFKG